ncbi:MAG: D-alanine--D-alanine ligase, partial [Bacteroidota bacterium]
PYDVVERQLAVKGIDFPLIVKPDVGERGFGVEKIATTTALQAHLQQYQHLALIIQEYIDFPLELGVMYYRLPNEVSGQISSVVEKEFLQVTGDGTSTLAQLFRQNKRTNYHFDMLATQYASELQNVLPAGEQKDLVSIGNHSRGTTFLNANHLITPQLIDVFDEISRSVTGYYFGRYDLRVPHLEDLYAGRNIKVLELNGANSEPAHIYDPQMPLWQAYKDLFKHWKALYQVSIQNHRKGVAYAPLGETVRKIRRYFKERRVRRD